MTGYNPAAAWPPILLSAVLLLWPAALNGYPIVFADTGTYLSQAIEHYLGWDRPPFYSAFMLPLHMTLTLWPVIVVQGILACHTLHLVRRVLLPARGNWFLLLFVGGLSGLTCLPWLTCEIMPDLFTPLLVLGLALLALAPERLSGTERIWLVLLSAFMIASQQSSVPLAIALTAFLALLRPPTRVGGWMRLFAPTILAAVALVSVNLVGHGRLSLSPFGNVFLLARVIYDGPGMDVLRRDCPQAGWRLCAELDRFPATSDDFLWLPNSPVMRAGGHKAVSAEADAIIGRALVCEPGRALKAFLANWWEQLTRFESGDGFEPWPDTVTPWITREFPRFERAAYQSARQPQGRLGLPGWVAVLHSFVGLLGVALCLISVLRPGRVPFGAETRRAAFRAGPEPALRACPARKWFSPVVNPADALAARFAAVVLFSLVAGAAITGGLSAPHDRYQSRLIWLPPCIGALTLMRRGQQ